MSSYWVFRKGYLLEDAFETTSDTHEKAFRAWLNACGLDDGKTATMHVLCTDSLEIKTYEAKRELVVTLVSPSSKPAVELKRKPYTLEFVAVEDR